MKFKIIENWFDDIYLADKRVRRHKDVTPVGFRNTDMIYRSGKIDSSSGKNEYKVSDEERKNIEKHNKAILDRIAKQDEERIKNIVSDVETEWKEEKLLLLYKSDEWDYVLKYLDDDKRRKYSKNIDKSKEDARKEFRSQNPEYIELLDKEARRNHTTALTDEEQEDMVIGWAKQALYDSEYNDSMENPTSGYIIFERWCKEEGIRDKNRIKELHKIYTDYINNSKK